MKNCHTSSIESQKKNQMTMKPAFRCDDRLNKSYKEDENKSIWARECHLLCFHMISLVIVY